MIKKKGLTSNGIFSGVSMLITAGPTREMWDTVRFLSNLSSGKTGLALAKMAIHAGADVTLIAGNRNYDIKGVKFVHAVSGVDMFEAVKKKIDKCEVFISAAAVTDFKPVKRDKKIKKKNALPVMKLRRNPDILKWVGKTYPDKLLVGFSLEDKVDIKNGLLKKKEKNCRIMVLNNVKNLGSDLKTFTLISDDGISKYKDLSLADTAGVILKKCQSLL